MAWPVHTRSFQLFLKAPLHLYHLSCTHHTMPSRAHTIWNIQATLTLPILWSFTALLLAMIIPPPSLNTQLQPVYHHSPRADIDATGAGRTALILTAHPDDEAMFFSPTIMGLKNHGWEVRGLCLSTGNAEGLGAERVEELKRSYGVFGLQESHVKWLNDSLVDMFQQHCSADN